MVSDPPLTEFLLERLICLRIVGWSPGTHWQISTVTGSFPALLNSGVGLAPVTRFCSTESYLPSWALGQVLALLMDFPAAEAFYALLAQQGVSHHLQRWFPSK